MKKLLSSTKALGVYYPLGVPILSGTLAAIASKSGWDGNYVAELWGATFAGTLEAFPALIQYFRASANEETLAPLVDIGVRRVIPRGTRDNDQWAKCLRATTGKLIFFGKDHNRLLEHQLESLADRLKAGCTVQFYLRSERAEVYKTNPEELRDLRKAKQALIRLEERFSDNPSVRNSLVINEYLGEPQFSFTKLGETIYFGIYLHGVENQDSPEFEIHQTAENSWFWKACHRAFDESTKTAVRIDPRLSDKTEATA